MATKSYVRVGGRIVAQIEGGVRIDYLTDALGSVTAVVDSSQNIIETFRYRPYGAPLSPASPSSSYRFLWTGDTGSRRTLVKYSEQYNRARHYGTTTASWTTVDALWPDESAYTYCSGDPVTLVDIAGRGPVKPLRPPRIGIPPGSGRHPIVPLPRHDFAPLPPWADDRDRRDFVSMCVIALGVDAIKDLINWGNTGEPGPFTQIGDEIGRRLFPGVNELPADPGRQLNPDECDEHELARRQRLVDKLCKDKNDHQINFNCHKKPKKQFPGCLAKLNKCIAAREAVCKCYVLGCDDNHERLIERLKKQRGNNYERAL